MRAEYRTTGDAQERRGRAGARRGRFGAVFRGEQARLPDIVLETDAMEAITETGGKDADKVVLYTASLNKYLQPVKPAAQCDSPRVASLRRRVVARLQLTTTNSTRPCTASKASSTTPFFPQCHSSES
jgi:hypothetical protein